MDEEPLLGGVANAGAVVRVGDHVLRPTTVHTASIHRLLHGLRKAGFDASPRPLGIDPDGRERLQYIEGEVPTPPYPAWVQTDGALASIAALLSRFHAAAGSLELDEATWSSEMADPEGGSTVVHNDVCLENVVFRDGEAVALLDFDFCAPGRPTYDLARCLRMCVPIDDDLNASRLGWHSPDRPRRLRLAADAYGLDADGRSALLVTLSLIHI